MSRKVTVCCVLFFLMAGLVSAGPKKDPGLNRGLFSVFFAGLRGLTRFSARTTPQDNARTLLEAMQTHLQSMQRMTALAEAQVAFAQMQDLQRQYLTLIQAYGVLTNPEAARLMEDARAIVRRLEPIHGTPVRPNNNAVQALAQTPQDRALSLLNEIGDREGLSPLEIRVSQGLRANVADPERLRTFLNEILLEQFAEQLAPLRGHLDALLRAIEVGRPAHRLVEEPIQFDEVPDFEVNRAPSALPFNEIPDFGSPPCESTTKKKRRRDQ